MWCERETAGWHIWWWCDPLKNSDGSIDEERVRLMVTLWNQVTICLLLRKDEVLDVDQMTLFADRIQSFLWSMCRGNMVFDFVLDAESTKKFVAGAQDLKTQRDQLLARVDELESQLRASNSP